MSVPVKVLRIDFLGYKCTEEESKNLTEQSKNQEVFLC